LKHRVYRTIIAGLHATGLHHLFAPIYGGVGAILMFHHVRPAEPKGTFAPNRFLAVTPEFFDALLAHLRKCDIDIITMSDVYRRLIDPQTGNGRQFACLTFDDGYVDNADIALPICRRHNAPMTLYATSGLINGSNFPWWLVSEAILREHTQLTFVEAGQSVTIPAASHAEKHAAFLRLGRHLQTLTAEAQTAFVLTLVENVHFDIKTFHRAQVMGWDKLAQMAADPLVEIGAHTGTHCVLKAQTVARAKRELAESRAILAERLGRPIDHFAYPGGGRDQAGPREFGLASQAGFLTAVTTRHGALHPEHRRHLHALPRLSINGLHQQLQTVDVFLSGASAALANRFKRVVSD
jgi:peptidoglycan/xylan/chitin deacetylase (PgdA/CDA1 family)